MNRIFRYSKPHLMSLESRLSPAIINFTITTATSSLTFGGTVGGAPIQAQGTGSLTTTYFGTGQVDVDFAANTITGIAAGSLATANTNGNWQPLPGGATGSAAADYGAKVSIPILPPFVFANALIAARNLSATLDSSALPLSGTGATKTFPSTQNFNVVTGDADYSAGTLGSGTQSLVGNSAVNQATTPGSFTDNGDGTYQLTSPIDVTINDTVSGQPAVYTIKGTINATAVLPVVDLNGAAIGFDTSFTSGGTPAVAIAPAATITRNPSANLEGMTVTLASPPDGASESLAVDLTGTGLTTTGYDSTTGTLKITGSGTLATYQSVLQKVSYSDTKYGPTNGTRTLTVTVDDGTNISLSRTATGTVTTLPAKISAVQVNDGSAQRSRVTSLLVTFDQHVSLPATPANAFQLKRQSDGIAVGLAAAVSDTGPSTAVTLTFTSGPVESTSLADGRYTLTVVASNVDAGNFDGNGNGIAEGSPTDDYVLVGAPGTAPNLFRFFGDINGDGTVSASDFIQFRQYFGGVNPAFDFDGDGSIAASDFIQFRLRFGGSI
jgi:hypothetical protein